MASHGLNCRSTGGRHTHAYRKPKSGDLSWDMFLGIPSSQRTLSIQQCSWHRWLLWSIMYWYSRGFYLYFSSTSSILVLTAVFIRHREMSRFYNLGDFYTLKHSSCHWNPNLRILVLFKYLYRDSVDFHVPIYIVTNKIKN